MNLPKILKDTLQEPKSGKYSRKSITTIIFVVMAVLTGSFIVVSDYILPESKSINQYAIMVFFGFTGKAGYDLYLTVQDKIKNGKTDDRAD